ncbi:MAG TPA: hypothetical protein VF628_07385 [Allosphingosinicella sp.]|jgi:hypothetical protein
MPNPTKSRRSCLLLLLLALAMIAGAVWFLTDFVPTPSTATMPPRAGNNMGD